MLVSDEVVLLVGVLSRLCFCYWFPELLGYLSDVAHAIGTVYCPCQLHVLPG